MNIKSIVTALTLLAAANANATILSDWQGNWQGQCQFQAPGSTDIESIPITIDILPLNANEITFTMNHMRATGDEVRDYIIRGIDPATGHYVTDEQNGILIDQYLRQNRLMQNFEVNGRNVTIVLELNGNMLNRSAYSFGTSSERRFRKQGVTVYGEPSLDACVLTR